MKTKLFLALLLAAVVTWGCASSDTVETASAPTASAQKTGTVTFSIKFPTEGAQKAFIDGSTSKVTINGNSWDYSWYTQTPVELTPANPTATIEVPAGQICFYAQSTDSSMMVLDNASTCGEVVAGFNNKATMTFLGADWEFVNNAHTPTPMTFSSASHGTVSLAGFRLSTTNTGMPAKAAIDFTKPNGWADYRMQYFSGTTTNAAKFAPEIFAESTSQFLPGSTASTNYNAFSGGEVNLDTPANTSAGGQGIEAGWTVGERVAFILDEVSGPGSTDTITTSTGQDGIPVLQTYADSKVVDSTAITGHFLEMTYGALPTKTEKTANVDCYLYWQQNSGMQARTAALKSSVAAAIAGRAGKAAPGNATTIDAGTITVTYDSCEIPPATGGMIGSIYTYSETFSNVIAREFRAEAKQRGTSFALPPSTITANNAYIEYRTNENSAADRHFGWVEYKDSGVLVNQTDFTGVKLIDPSGAAMQSTAVFQKFSYTTGTWNGTSFGTSLAVGGHSGFYFDLSSYTALATGTYNFRANLATGQTLDTPVTVGSLPALPFVSSVTMTNTWNTDNSLTLSWVEPVGTFGSYRIVILKPLATGGFAPIFFAKANPGTSSITLSATELAQIALTSGVTDTTALSWQVQTRSYDANNVEIGRGYSLNKAFGAGGTGLIIR